MLSVFLLVACSLLLFGLGSNWLLKKDCGLDRIPTIGPSGLLGSYVGALRYLFDARGMVKEGYEKHKGTLCKIPTFRGWIVLVNNPACIETLAKTQEGLSFREAVAETFQTDYLLGRSISKNPYHVELVRGPVARNISSAIPAIQQAVRDTVIESLIPRSDNTGIPVILLAKRLVQNTNSRLFFGPPSYRTAKLNRACEIFTNNFIIASHILKLFPDWLKAFVPRTLTGVPNVIRNSSRLLDDIISDSVGLNGGSWDGYLPGGTVSEMLFSIHNPAGRNMEEVTTRMLIMKMSADHSTTLALDFLLYDLVAHPREVSIMRDEIEAAVEETGWGRESFKKMSKLDSFIKESQRLSPLGAYTMMCKATKDVVFPDGSIVPTGAMVAVPGSAILTSEDHYANAHQFKAWRFENIVSTEGHNLHTNPHHMVFGYGRHVCPGRMIALQILKSIAAQLILDYDMELECDRFPPLYIGAGYIPDICATIHLRRRSVLKPLQL